MCRSIFEVLHLVEIPPNVSRLSHTPRPDKKLVWYSKAALFGYMPGGHSLLGDRCFSHGFRGSAKRVRKSGVKHTTLTKIESGVVVRPSVQTVAKIAKALGVPMEDLVK
jgi:hypothetical protein